MLNSIAAYNKLPIIETVSLFIYVMYNITCVHVYVLKQKETIYAHN